MNAAEQVREVAEDLRSETTEFAQGTKLRTYGFAALSVFIAGYLFWGYHRIQPFTDPIFVADTIVELGQAQVPGLIDDVSGQVVQNAGEIINEAEDQIEGTIVNLRQQLEGAVGEGLGDAISTAMAERDAAFFSKLSAHPELALKAVDSPKDAQALVALMIESDRSSRAKKSGKLVQDGLAELTLIRDRVKRLQQNKALSPVEKAERRLLLGVLGQVPLPPPERQARAQR